MKNEKVKRVVTIGMLAALAYIVVAFIKIPVFSFLKYEPKDVVIVIGGFIFGPSAAFVISLIVSIIEMFTVSDTGWIGAVMNLVSSCAFACTAAIVYRIQRTRKSALSGLMLGVFCMTAMMMLWNYLLTPIYMGYPIEAVVAMLPTVFLPFNLLKGGINAIVAFFLYKPVVTGLRKAGLVPLREVTRLDSAHNKVKLAEMATTKESGQEH